MANVQKLDKFELGRQSDALVYTFVRKTRPDGTSAYQREDQDFWIAHRPDWGWVAWDPVTQSCTGRPWNVLPPDQGDHTPEGDWVSRKRPKSYVYRLVYVG
jgi:hypothetical protein